LQHPAPADQLDAAPGYGGWRPDTPDPQNDWPRSKLLGPMRRKTPENPSLRTSATPLVAGSMAVQVGGHHSP
jgi:hypothetical protein